MSRSSSPGRSEVRPGDPAGASRWGLPTASSRLVLAVLVTPLWLAAVGVPMAPPFLNASVPGTIASTVGHVVYAGPVALVYALVTNDRT